MAEAAAPIRSPRTMMMMGQLAALPRHRRGGAPLGSRSVRVRVPQAAGAAAPIALVLAEAATARLLSLRLVLQQAASALRITSARVKSCCRHQPACHICRCLARSCLATLHQRCQCSAATAARQRWLQAAQPPRRRAAELHPSSLRCLASAASGQEQAPLMMQLRCRKLWLQLLPHRLAHQATVRRLQ